MTEATAEYAEALKGQAPLKKASVGRARPRGAPNHFGDVCNVC
jgi:hypothetical protein